MVCFWKGGKRYIYQRAHGKFKGTEIVLVLTLGESVFILLLFITIFKIILMHFTCIHYIYMVVSHFKKKMQKEMDDLWRSQYIPIGKMSKINSFNVI